jgi:hypothetical protein
MDMDRLMESVKKHEGYRNKVYLDTLGKRTVGVGHLCVESFWEDDKEYEEKFLMEILQKDLQENNEGDYMIYKGQKLSDNLTQSQRDMFKYMIDNGHSVDDIVKMYFWGDDIVKMYLGNVKDTFFTEDKEEE